MIGTSRDWYRSTTARKQMTVRGRKGIRASVAPHTGDRNIRVTTGDTELSVWLKAHEWRELERQANGEVPEP